MSKFANERSYRDNATIIYESFMSNSQQFLYKNILLFIITN